MVVVNLYISEQTLENLYFEEKKSIREVAKQLYTSDYNVKKYMKKYGLKLRSLKECHEGKLNAAYGKKLPQERKDKIRKSVKKWMDEHPEQQFKKGPENIAWRGGVTNLSEIIRNCYEYKIWRSSIFKRDNFKCVICNKIKKYNKIQADHIKSFALILKENNIKTLEEALNCKELWDENNGRTLCVSCHKKTPTYLKRLK